ncbi:MAG: hypothetical protein NC299_09395 [Lachnospiraceae bacterium]|nr:hypothetical protein [Ruminococcus sp.]MCM1275568.1 hypothetical protein [Lachnospiraceae bacterium]
MRAKRGEYVFSKTLAGTVAGAFFILAFFVGTMLGGAISRLSFALEGTTIANVVMCLLSKIFLIGVFAAMYVLASVIAKQKTWLAMIISLGIGMLLFMMIPMITPLDAGIMNVILCLTVSNVILKKTSFV